MPRPSKLPNWATTPAAGDLVEPPDPTKVTGWLAAFKPPNSWVNYWWNLVYQWVLHFSETSQLFTDLTTAVTYSDDNLAAGDLLIVFEDDNNTGPGVEEYVVATPETSADGGIDACGDRVVVSNGILDPRGVTRELVGFTTGSPAPTYVRTNAGQNYGIKTDGVVTVAAYGNYLEAFDAVTGISQWLFDNSVPVNDIALAAGAVYIVSDITVGGGDAAVGKQLHKLDLATGAILWSYQHSAANDLLSVCTNGRQVFVSGAVSTLSALINMRAIRASNGKDFDGVGGNGQDLTGLSWNRAEAFPSLRGHVMDCDGTMLYSGLDNTATYQLEVIGQADGVLAMGIAHPDATMQARDVSVDQDYIYLCTTNAGGTVGHLEAYDKRTGALVFYGAESVFTTGTPLVGSASDGCKVFAVGISSSTVQRFSRGNVPTRFRKIDRAAEFVRYRNWKLQPEAQ